MEFETAPKELQELCLCGGGPMGKDHFPDAKKMVPLETLLKTVVTSKLQNKQPDEHGQGEIDGNRTTVQESTAGCLTIHKQRDNGLQNKNGKEGTVVDQALFDF